MSLCYDPDHFARTAAVICLWTWLALGLAQTSPAEAAEQWQIRELSGPVTVVTSGGTALGAAGQIVLDGSTITTGVAARAVIVRGQDRISLLPNSRVTLPTSSLMSSFTTIIQELGDALFSIGKKDHPHFEVDTPYLTATVKGTSFLVHVDAKGANVSVREGIVEVATSWRQSVTLTHAGEAASVRESTPEQIDLTDRSGTIHEVTGVALPGQQGATLRSGFDPPAAQAGRTAFFASVAAMKFAPQQGRPGGVAPTDITAGPQAKISAPAGSTQAARPNASPDDNSADVQASAATTSQADQWTNRQGSRARGTASFNVAGADLPTANEAESTTHTLQPSDNGTEASIWRLRFHGVPIWQIVDGAGALLLIMSGESLIRMWRRLRAARSGRQP